MNSSPTPHAHLRLPWEYQSHPLVLSLPPPPSQWAPASVAELCPSHPCAKSHLYCLIQDIARSHVLQPTSTAKWDSCPAPPSMRTLRASPFSGVFFPFTTTCVKPTACTCSPYSAPPTYSLILHRHTSPHTTLLNQICSICHENNDILHRKRTLQLIKYFHTHFAIWTSWPHERTYVISHRFPNFSLYYCATFPVFAISLGPALLST